MAIALVSGQHAAASFNTGASSIAVSFPATTGAGNLIAAFSMCNSAQTSTAPTDDKSNTYAASAPETTNTTGGQNISGWYAKNVVGGTLTVTAHFSASTSFGAVGVSEYSGVDPVAPLDQVGGQFTAASADALSPSRTPTQNNELIWGAAVNNIGASNTTGTSFTLLDTSAGSGYAHEYFVQDVPASIAAEFKTGSSGAWAVLIATFKALGAAPLMVPRSMRGPFVRFKMPRARSQGFPPALFTVVASQIIRDELLLGLAKTTDENWEASGTVTTQNAENWEALQFVSQTSVEVWEALAAIIKSQIVRDELLQGIKQTAVDVWEALGLVTTSEVTNWEALALITLTAAENWEAMQLLNTTSVSNWEALQNVIQSAIENWEALGLVSVTGVDNWEAGGTVTKTAVENWEALQGNIVASRVVRDELLKGLAVVAAAAWEALQNVSATSAANWEAIGLLLAQMAANWEAAGLTVATAVVNWESTVSIVVTTAVVNWEAIGRLLQRASANWESVRDFCFTFPSPDAYKPSGASPVTYAAVKPSGDTFTAKTPVNVTITPIHSGATIIITIEKPKEPSCD